MTALTVLASLPKAIIAAAATYQVDPKALARSAGVSPEALDAPGGRISDAAARRLWQCAVAATGDPCLGLVAAQHHLATSFHALGDVFKRLVRYERVLLNAKWIALEENGGRTALRLLQLPDTEPAASYRTDAAFATLLRWIQHLSLGEIAPLAVEFRHADHGQRARYEELFKTALTFGAAADRLWFDNAVLTRALPASVRTFQVATVVEGGIPTAAITVRRSDVERLEHQPAAAMRAVTLINDAMEVPKPKTLTRVDQKFRWSLGPALALSLFDPEEPVRSRRQAAGRAQGGKVPHARRGAAAAVVQGSGSWRRRRA